MTPRRCAECMECCFGLSVPELRKPAHSWCSHAHEGCQIYPKRPGSCRRFECGWLRGYGEAEDRPDKLGVIFDWQLGPNGEALLKAFVTRDTARGRERIDAASDEIVVVEIRRDSRVLHGPEQLVDAVVAGAGDTP